MSQSSTAHNRWWSRLNDAVAAHAGHGARRWVRRLGPAGHLAVGDLVWFRHAKSGEPFEHTTTVQLLSGSEFVDEVRTYRGHGLAF